VTGNAAEGARYARFGIVQRVEHALLILSFTTLAVTGLPQKFATATISDQVIRLLGGIEAVRVVHRWAAVLLMLQTIYHLAEVAFQVLVQRSRLSMLPRYWDLIDGWQALRYNLGLASERPRMRRFTFEEKLEYWSLIWGTVLMILTGFMLWNPIATARFLPGQVIPAAQAAHGAEAVLAVLAIIIWHGYAVHVRHFNRSMWTGYLDEHIMGEEHPLELEEIQTGRAPTSPEAAAVARGRRIFLPVAAIVALALLYGLYVFVTFEQTAITTLPPTR
jgi:cytochrome b subunit of formate dehydrogenase